jgi:hypothetical protein
VSDEFVFGPLNVMLGGVGVVVVGGLDGDELFEHPLAIIVAIANAEMILL